MDSRSRARLREDNEPERKAAMLANTAASLPLERTGVPSDMGQALDFLLCSPFTTGVVLDCDGGHHIRQYADAGADPMRAKSAELDAWKEAKLSGAKASD